MELSNGKCPYHEADDLAEAQSHVWNHALHYIHSMSLRCAIQLGIPDIIHGHGHPMALHELVSALSIHPERAYFVHRLMRILVNSGFFAHKKIGDDENEGYVLKLPSRILLKGHPFNISPSVLLATDPFLVDPYHFLSKWLYCNDDEKIPTPFMEKNKQEVWEYVGQDPEKNRVTNEAMASDTPVTAKAVIDKCRATFESATSLVDVGGGTGELARAVAEEFPHLDCTVLDLPHVVSGLKGDKNLKFVAGDMFVAIPPADAILLKWILHDWSDKKSLKILKHCREAITTRNTNNEGKVIIIDIVIENDNNKQQTQSFAETKLLFDVMMMVNFSGKERNEEEWARLFHDAGFSNYKITPLVGFRSLIELYP